MAFHWEVEDPIATDEAQHAKAQGSSPTPCPRAQTAADCPQLSDRPEYCPSILEGGHRGRCDLAPTARLGRATAGRGRRRGAPPDRSVAEDGSAGLWIHPTAVADPPQFDLATGLGRIPGRSLRRIQL